MNLVLKSVATVAFVATIATLATSSHTPEPEPALAAATAPTVAPRVTFNYALRDSQEKRVLTLHLSSKYRQPFRVTDEIVQAAYSEGRRHGVSPLLLLAMAEKESSLRQNVTNDYGAMGLMQVVPRFHPEKVLAVGDAHILSPAGNMRIGAWILSEYLNHFKGDLSRALVKYSGNAHNYASIVERNQAELERVRASIALLRT